MEKELRKILIEKINSIINGKEKIVNYSFAGNVISISIDKGLLQAKIGNTYHRLGKENAKKEYNVNSLLKMISDSIILSYQIIESAKKNPSNKKLLKTESYSLNSKNNNEILYKDNDGLFIFDINGKFIKKEINK